jgi:hypothetical protein
MIDLNLALYTHYETGERWDSQCEAVSSLLLGMVGALIGAPFRVVRVASFIQGALTFLDADAEFRVHVWFELPEGHPDFPQADRGLASLVQAVTPEGLVGPSVGEVGWLGAPLPPDAPSPSPGDWVAFMEAQQGYRDLPGSDWSWPTCGLAVVQVMSWMLARHLEATVNRRADGPYGCELQVVRKTE